MINDPSTDLHFIGFVIGSLQTLSQKPSLSFLPRLEILEALPQEDVVLLLRVVELVAHRPVVRHGVGEDLTVGVERAASDRLLHGL